MGQGDGTPLCYIRKSKSKFYASGVDLASVRRSRLPASATNPNPASKNTWPIGSGVAESSLAKVQQ
jgi:hypothetical protein